MDQPGANSLRQKGLLWAGGCLVVLLLAVGALPSSGSSPLQAASANILAVSFINVGQGDSALLRDNGFDVLIDGGPVAAGPTVVAYLRNQGVPDIDVLVVSHPDADHIGGLIAVLQAPDIPVLQVLYNGYPGSTATWQNFVAAVVDEGLTLTVAQYPQVFAWGELEAHILNPEPGLGSPATNAASLVILLDHDQNQFLFPGDIDSNKEATVVARGTPVAAEILKVAHHGSAYSSSELFLAAVQPDEAIISVGDNSYGHPAADTIARLRAAGAQVWRTDLCGTILVTSDGLSYTIWPEIAPIYSLTLPLIIKSIPPPTPTPQPTATPLPPSAIPTVAPSSTPTQPVPTPTPAPTPWAATGNVVIVSIFYDGAGSQEPDEHVVIRNDDTLPIQLQIWTLWDIAEHVYTFPYFFIQPGQTCRIYTNEDHPEWCSFNYGHGSAVWNNTGDCAYLRNAQGQPIDEFCY